MQQRLDKHVSSASASPSQAADSVKSNEALVSATPPTAWNNSEEERQAAILSAFLENKYAASSPMPASLRNPRSDPKHYDRLIAELDEAPTRSWFEGIVKRIKGGLRFS